MFAAAARAGQAAAPRAFRSLSFFRPNPSRGVPGGERGDGPGRGGRVPRPRGRGRPPRLGLFGLSRFFGQTPAAGCDHSSGLNTRSVTITLFIFSDSVQVLQKIEMYVKGSAQTYYTCMRSKRTRHQHYRSLFALLSFQFIGLYR